MLKSAQIIILQHPKPKHSQPSNLAAAILGLLLAIGGIVEANPLTINQPLTQRAYQQCGEQSINSPHILLSYYNNVDGEPLALCYRDRVVRPLYQRPNIRSIYSVDAEAVWPTQSDIKIRVAAQPTDSTGHPDQPEAFLFTPALIMISTHY